MFKKMRNRLLMVNMIALSVIIIVVFAIIYAITYSNTMKELELKAKDVEVFFTSKDSVPAEDENGNGSTTSFYPSANESQPQDYKSSFNIYLDSDFQIFLVASYIDLDESSYALAVDVINNTNKTTGQIKIKNKTWQFYVHMDIWDTTSNGKDQELATNRISFHDVTSDMQSLTNLLITLIVSGIVVLILLFGISFFFANRSIKPMELAWEKQKQFVTDASHELKTPIAIISANIDAIESDKESSVESQKKWFGYAKSELNRMNKLIGDLLYLAQNEAEKKQSEMVFDLSRLVKDAATSMEVLIYERNIDFSIGANDSIFAQADESKIKQAILILLDNAVKYCNPGGWINITLTKERGVAKFSIKNSGAEINANDLANIFDRFYRPDKSRSTSSGGYGLGLSIAKTIIDRSGGKIAAASSDGVTEFYFTLKSK